MYTVRKAIDTDLPGMVAIAEAKRVEYEGYSPVFWRKARDSSPRHESYLQHVLTGNDVIPLVAEYGDRLVGFIIAAVVSAPPVYEPEGLVCIVDDFAVEDDATWQQVGKMLLDAAESEAKNRGAVLSVVVCAQKDNAKRQLLQSLGATVASEWHVKPL